MVNNTVYNLLVLTWGLRYFLEKREHQKRMHWNRGLRHLCLFYIGVSKNSLIIFLVIKGILKALFSFIPWLLNFSDLPNYGSNPRKGYTLTLLSKCLVRSTFLPIEGKVPPQPFHTLFDSLRWAPFSLALHLCSC